jgi:hypothetical protein
MFLSREHLFFAAQPLSECGSLLPLSLWGFQGGSKLPHSKEVAVGDFNEDVAIAMHH